MTSYGKPLVRSLSLLVLLALPTLISVSPAKGAEQVAAPLKPTGNYICDFVMTRIGAGDAKRREFMAFGEAIVSNGKIRLLGEYLTEGKDQSSPFAGSELMIDDSGNVTGNMLVYHLFEEPGKPHRRPLNVAIASDNGPFANPSLGGSTTFRLDREFLAEWLLIHCR